MSRSSPTRALLALSLTALLLPACGGGDAPPAKPSGAGAQSTAVLPEEPAGPPDPEVAATVEQVLGTARLPGLKWSSIADVAPLLKQFYDREPDRLFWFAGTTPVPMIDDALASLAAAADHGLDPADYDPAHLAQSWAAVRGDAVSATDRALFDLGLSVAAARMVTAVHLGRVDPAVQDWGYDLVPKRLDLEETLLGARRGQGLSAGLAALQPPFAHYARARKTLAAYRALAAAGEPDPVPELPKGRKKVEPGKPWDGVPLLVARLRVLGDLAPHAADGGTAEDGTPLYAGAVVEAVESFQQRHGLEADGVIGPATIQTLNVSLAQRVRQIELAMERMRWLPKMSERPTVFVNVPLFRLWATDPQNGEEPLRMNVVVGKSLNHKTPIFIEQMKYVIFRPYWNPPPSIIRSEIVPHARRDPSYVERQNMEIVASGDEGAPALPPTPENLDRVAAGTLYLRQKPGPKNSLGLAKFIFPNAENVYMHGTPAQSLFARARRDFSHGCIRLEDPASLAVWVLRDEPEWTRDRIEAAMNGERPTQVNLKEPLDVVLFYDTVHVNSEGVVSFADDIYGHDRQLDTALRKGYPYPVKG